MIAVDKKTQFEQRAVIGLLVFFLFALSGALKGMGIGGFRVGRPPLRSGSAMGSKTAGPSRQGTASDSTSQPKLGVGHPAGASGGRQGYTAQALRSPFHSLLPSHAAVAPHDSAQASLGADAPVTRMAPPPSLSVQGVWWKGSKPLAIINGRIYGLGDPVGGATITAITRTGVTIDFQGTTMQVTTTGPLTKQRSALSQGTQ